MAEVGAPKPIGIKNEEYDDKIFNLTILQGKDVVNKWKNIEIESVDFKIIHFLHSGINVTVLSAENHTIIIEEIKIEE